jgi:hypothetical protein
MPAKGVAPFPRSIAHCRTVIVAYLLIRLEHAVFILVHVKAVEPPLYELQLDEECAGLLEFVVAARPHERPRCTVQSEMHGEVSTRERLNKHWPMAHAAASIASCAYACAPSTACASILSTRALLD